MPVRYSVVFDDSLAEQIRDIAREYGLTEEEVLRQLVDLGLDELGEQATV